MVRDRSRWGDMPYLLGGWSGLKDPGGNLIGMEAVTLEARLENSERDDRLCEKDGKFWRRRECTVGERWSETKARWEGRYTGSQGKYVLAKAVAANVGGIRFDFGRGVRGREMVSRLLDRRHGTENERIEVRRTQIDPAITHTSTTIPTFM